MSKILYLFSLNPITVQNDPTQETQKIADKLANNADFRRAQKRLIKDGYGIDQSLFYQSIGKSFDDLPIPQKIRDYLNSLPGCALGKENMPLTAFDAIILMLCANVMIDLRAITSLSVPLFRHIVGKTKIMEVVGKYPSEQIASILIPYSTSKNELIQWVEDSWDQIKESQAKLPKFRTNYLPKELEVHEQIYSWRNQGLSFKDIVAELLKQYPDDKRFMSESDIRKMYQRHVKYVSDGFSSALRMNALFWDIK